MEEIQARSAAGGGGAAPTRGATSSTSWVMGRVQPPQQRPAMPTAAAAPRAEPARPPGHEARQVFFLPAHLARREPYRNTGWDFLVNGPFPQEAQLTEWPATVARAKGKRADLVVTKNAARRRLFDEVCCSAARGISLTDDHTLLGIYRHSDLRQTGAGGGALVRHRRAFSARCQQARI